MRTKLKWLLLVIGISVSHHTLFAQQQQQTIDSLEIVLKAEKNPNNRFIQLKDLASLYLHIDPNKAIKYGDEAINLTSKIEVYLYDVVELYMSLGLAHYYLGNSEASLEYYLEGLRWGEDLENKLVVGQILTNIGLLHYQETNYPKALEYLEKGIKMLELYDATGNIVNALNNIGNIYYQQGQKEKALGYYKRAMKLAEQSNDKQSLVNSSVAMAFMKANAAEYKEAVKYYNKALGLARELGDNNVILYALLNIGIVYQHLEDFDNAVASFNECYQVATQTNNTEMIKLLYRNFATMYALMEDYESAYKYEHYYSFYRDSITGQEKEELMAEMQEKYESEKKEQKIVLLTKDQRIKSLALLREIAEGERKEQQVQLLAQEKVLQQVQLDKEKAENERKQKEVDVLKKDQELTAANLKMQEAEVSRSRLQRNAFMGGAGLLMLLSMVAFRGYRQKKKSSEQLAEQNEKITNQKGLIEEKNKDIMDSIRYAQRIQEAILPPEKLRLEFLRESFVLFKPKDIVSGDFFWMEQKGSKVFFAAVDCTGHGVPGAIVSIVGHNGLNRCLNEFGLTQPASILDKLTELVEETFAKSESEVKDGMDMGLCCIDFDNNSLEYAGANNPLYLITGREPNEQLDAKAIATDTLKIVEIKADKQPIGKYADRKPFTNHQLKLKKGDAFYLFSDGFADQFGGPRGKKFKYKPLKQLLLEMNDQPMKKQQEVLNKTIDEWRGDLEQVDDICVFGVKA